jgi:hypothetical protein
MWTEDLVHECLQWAEGGVIIDGQNISCSFNCILLRALRKQYDIEYRPETCMQIGSLSTFYLHYKQRNQTHILHISSFDHWPIVYYQ